MLCSFLCPRSGVGKGRLKIRDLDFTPVRSWLGGDMTEKVEGWKCTVYEAAGKVSRHLQTELGNKHPHMRQQSLVFMLCSHC